MEMQFQQECDSVGMVRKGVRVGGPCLHCSTVCHLGLCALLNAVQILTIFCLTPSKILNLGPAYHLFFTSFLPTPSCPSASVLGLGGGTQDTRF